MTKVTFALLAALGTLAAGCGGDSETGVDCGMPFTEYSAGRSVAGHHFETREPNCGKRPFVTYIYGTCEATSDMGCAPPVQVQTWSACHRKPSLLGGAHVGLRRGETTIVIFAHSKRLARTAARALRKAQPPDRSLPATRRLRACGER